MNEYKIQQVFEAFYQGHSPEPPDLTDIQHKAALSILNCKSGRLGYHVSRCSCCGHMEFHSNSYRNRNCPLCQAVLKEIWVDKRRAEVIDSPYFHVVFTLPHELNPLIYCNQKLLYGLFHRCCAETLLELSADRKFLGAAPGIIQVLHTWNQKLSYHVYMHCIVSGGGYDGLPVSSLSLSESCGISSKENLWLALLPFMKMAPLPFLPPALI